jgi:hypothetical protein
MNKGRSVLLWLLDADAVFDLQSEKTRKMVRPICQGRMAKKANGKLIQATNIIWFRSGARSYRSPESRSQCLRQQYTHLCRCH